MPPPDSVYPAALDDFPVIEPNSGEAAPETEHDIVHEHVHQGLKAVQATVGVTGSDVPGTVHYRLDSLEAAVTEIDEELDGKAAASHTHGWSDIGGTPTTLAGYGITDADASGTAAAAVAAHESATDPHPQYLTAAEGAAAYQPLDADLTAISALTGTGMPERTADNTWVLRTVAAVGRSLLALASAGAIRFIRVNADGSVTLRADTELRTDLGLGALALLGSINDSNWSGTDLSVANGGTGASTLTGYVKGNGTAAMTASATIPNADITGLGTMATQAAADYVTLATAQGIPGDKAFLGRVASREAYLTTTVAELDDVLAAAQTREVDLALAPVQTLLTEFDLTLDATGPTAAAGWVVLYVYNAGASAIDVTRGTGWFGSAPLSVDADETCKFHLHWDGVRMSAGLIEAAGAASGDLRPDPTGLTITGGPLPSATEGTAYSDTLTIGGGVPPYTLGTVSGLPAGLSAAIDGTALEITGTPDAGESADSPFSLSIEVEDAEAETEVYTQSFVVTEPEVLLSDAIVALGPFAYYQLGEGSGATSFADSSGNGFDLGTIVPTVTAGGTGLIAEGTSTDFDGSGYITSGNNEFGADLELAFDTANADGSFSIVCLVNFDDVGSGDKRIFQAGNLSVNNVQGFGLAVNGGNVGIYVKTAGGSIDQVFTSGSPVSSGVTKMLAVTRDGLGATRIFVDGVKLVGPSSTGAGVRLLASDALGGTRITIGASYGSLGGGGTGNMINGRCQHVALFAAELTEAQVLELAEIAGLA